VSLVALEIPKVGLVMESARLVRWLKHVGEMVKQGEPLLELETEKSVVEIESTESGRLVEILLQVDQEARVGDRVAWLENDPNGAAESGGAPAYRAESKPAAVPVGAAASTPGSAQSNTVTAFAMQQQRTGRVKSSPVARRLAAEHSLDLRQVQPTGPRGRVQLSDVRREIESRGAQKGPAPQARLRAALAAVGSQPLSSMRRAVARSMTLSNATIPQFIVERSVDWTVLHAIRGKLTTELPSSAVKPTVNDFLLQAIARTLLAFPHLNATFTGDPTSSDAALLPATGTHIGLVVAVENGLLVPVLHDVDQIGIAEIARRRSEIVRRALSGRPPERSGGNHEKGQRREAALKREELEGATFSLSNLGARGPDRFTAIISPPQSAILAVGRQRDCVVAMNGGIHVRPISQLTLTVDHRVADGRLAADFLAFLVDTLEGDTWRLH
jgi:pyruvate dehydrogenase E2 component (dihydrolipoyllysine-residue acetyltransferase)